MGKLKELIFLFFRFFVSYGVMLVFYQLYLNEYNINQNTVDPYTKQLAIQISILMDTIGMENSLVHFVAEKGIGFVLHSSGMSISYLNEGCNVISIMIIFIAFAITFYSSFVKTFLYILFGLFFLYLSNLTRIILLNIVLYRWSDYTQIAHDIIFPIIIYSSVVLLWIGWILLVHTNKYKFT